MAKTFTALFFFLQLWMFGLKAQDRFARIGAQEYTLQRELLIEPSPSKLPATYLPGGIIGADKFTIPPLNESKEQLYRELDSLRAVYRPFLMDFSPLMKYTRSRMRIDSMLWREETAEEKIGTQYFQSDRGKWEKVSIPHYGPPLGHAVTYYKKEIELSDSMFTKERLFICFKGVDYKAEVYFNGNYCGGHEGFFAPFEFDITKYARRGGNTLLVKVINEPTTTGSADGYGNHVVGDKIYAAGGPGYNEPVEGWHICPPAMGIYQDCYLEARSDLFVKDVFVRANPLQSAAEVWIEIFNAGLQPREVMLDLSVFGKNFQDTVFTGRRYIPSTTIVPGIGDMVKPTDWEKKALSMQYGVNYLRIPIPMEGFRWWQPAQPWLYKLQVDLYSSNERMLDQQAVSFGMRTFTMDTTAIPKGRMFLNGNPIRLRGANSMGFEQNDVMRKDWKQLIDDILLAKLCNMNFFRFTQRPVQQEVYDYCDMLGMLNQTDLPFFGAIRINQFAEAVKQAEEMERLVRNHPSTVIVTYINERFPNAEGSPQRSYGSSKEVYSVFKAMDQAVLLSNPDRVIKAGDGDYDPPSPGLPDNHCYNTWYNGHALDLGKMHKGYWQLIKPDWLYGCGEFGAEGLDPLNTMKKYYPASWLPADAADNLRWTPSRISKAQSAVMHHMWYPTPLGLQNWIDESQQFQAWAVKFMTEAMRRDSRNVSLAVHLFIDAWPAGWMKAIMDVDRQPKKSFYAYRNALAPLMVSLRTDRLYWYAGEEASVEVWICNDRNDIPEGSRIGYEVVVKGKVILRQLADAKVSFNSSLFQGFLQFEVPPLKERTEGIIRVGLFNEKGEFIHRNEQQMVFYPSTQPIKKKVFIYEDDRRAKSLMSSAGLQVTAPLRKADVVLMTDHQLYLRDLTAIDLFVKAGGKVVFLELPKGEYAIADDMIEVQHTIMGEYYFVNPGKHLMERSALSSKDLFLWYDQQKGYIQPLLSHVFKADGWKPFITTGLCNFAGEDPSGYMAGASYRWGKGNFVLCEVQLSDRINENPPARELFRAIIDTELN